MGKWITKQSLPAPLEDSKLHELLERIQKGEDNLREEVVRCNLRLVAYIVKKFQNTGLDFDELFQNGSLGLLKAANTFDVSKKIKFATYASRCIENEILMALRRSKKAGRGVEQSSLDQPINTDFDGNVLYLSDITEDTRPGPEEIAISKLCSTDRMDVFKFYIKNADELSQKVWFYTFLGCTQSEVGDILHLSQSYISRVKKRDIAAMKKILSSYNKTGELRFFKRRTEHDIRYNSKRG